MQRPQCGKEIRDNGEDRSCPDRGQVVEAAAEGTLTAEHSLKIFLSYGHDQHAVDAERIKQDLESRGHEVWFDQQRLKEGRHWEQYIEEGLKWCDKVVLLMTPYSVRRRDHNIPDSRDGFCLNEIAKAIERNKLIIPLLLVELDEGPPVSICRIQYLDLRDAVPIAERETEYQKRFDRLIRAIEQNELDFEGGQARLVRLLQPLDFDAQIAPHVARFTGREWLFDELDKWIEHQPESRVFWLVGGPGVGKSALAAQSCHRRRDVVASHFCVHGHDDKADPRRAVLSLAYQLSSHLAAYEKKLQGMSLEEEQAKNAGTLFENLIVAPLRAADFPAPDSHRLVVIDALDEATNGGDNELADLIEQKWRLTPSWLRLVITSRPESAVMTRLQQADLAPFVLDASRSENIHDLRRYLRSELDQMALAADEEVLDAILERSEGLFLYLTAVLEELAHGRLSLDRIDEFPQGMAGYYRQFFARQFPQQTEYEKRLAPILAAITVQREPLPLDLLADACGLSDYELRKRLAALGSLFPVRRSSSDSNAVETIGPFHRSIGEWLTALDQKTHTFLASPYAVDAEAGRESLTRACWERYESGDPSRLTPYVRRQLASHLAERSEWPRLLTLIKKGDLHLLHRWIEAGEFREGRLCLSGTVDDMNQRNENPVLAAGLATQLARVHGRLGEDAEAKRRLNEALERLPFWRGRRVRAVALHELGSMAFYRGELKSAERLYRRALRACWLGLSRYHDEMGANLIGLATVAQQQYQQDRAIRLGSRGLEKARRAHDVRHCIAAERILANAFKAKLEFNSAADHLNAARVAMALSDVQFERPGLLLSMAWLEYYRVVLEGTAGDPASAFEQALAEAERSQNIAARVEAQLGLAWWALFEQSTANAGERLQQIDRVMAERYCDLTGGVMVADAALLHQSGRLAEAAPAYAEAVEFSRQYAMLDWEVDALVGLGAVQWHTGETDAAEEWWRQAQSAAARCSPLKERLVEVGVPRSRRDRRCTPC